MAELVDALASGASEHYARGGSSPLVRTKEIIHIAKHYTDNLHSMPDKLALVVAVLIFLRMSDQTAFAL